MLLEKSTIHHETFFAFVAHAWNTTSAVLSAKDARYLSFPSTQEIGRDASSTREIGRDASSFALEQLVDCPSISLAHPVLYVALEDMPITARVAATTRLPLGCLPNGAPSRAPSPTPELIPRVVPSPLVEATRFAVPPAKRRRKASKGARGPTDGGSAALQPACYSGGCSPI